MDPTEMLFLQDQIIVCFGLHMGFVNCKIDMFPFTDSRWRKSTPGTKLEHLITK